jgi:hypothetical protein
MMFLQYNLSLRQASQDLEGSKERGGGKERETTIVLNVATWKLGFQRMRNFCSLFPYFEKMNVRLYAHHIVCLCNRVSPPPINF